MSRRISLSGLLLLALVAFSGSAEAAWRLEGGRVVGDGRQPARLMLTSSPADPVKATDVEVRPSAGTVQSVNATDPGRFQVVFIPPRVADRLEVTLQARIKGKAVAAVKLQVVPPALDLGENASNGPFDLRGPRRLMLRQHDSAELSVQTEKGIDSWSFYVSRGSVGAPEKRPDGRVYTRYFPPPKAVPDVVVAAVVSHDGKVLDWISFRLFGRAWIDSRSEPYATVSIDVEGTEYGPARAAGNGMTRLPVLVPPGGKAAAVAVDRLGNKKRTRLDLGAPPFKRVLAVCPPEARSDVLIFAVNTAENPLRDEIEVIASHGPLTGPEIVGPGVARWRITSDKPLDTEVKFQATIVGEGASEDRCSTLP